MAIMKKIATAIVVVSMLINSAQLTAVSAQDKKKIAERKAQRKKEKTKGKAAAKAKSTKKRATTNKKQSVQTTSSSKTKASAVKVKAPVTKGSRVTSPVVSTKKAPVLPVVVTPNASTYYGGAETSMPTETNTYYGGAETIDVSMPTDMPSRLIDELIAMVPANLKNRIENIIMTYASDAQAALRNIYLLCWIDDELMKMFDVPNFNKMLLEVISQESGTPYATVEGMATDIKNSIDATFVRFENAIIAGDMNNFEIQQIINVFKRQEGYKEYLDRCLRLATEYNQSKMIMALKLAIANSVNVQDPTEDGDFDY